MVPVTLGTSNRAKLYADADRLAQLGSIHARQGRMMDAVDSFAAGLACMRLVGDRSGEADLLTELGQAFVRQGRQRAATGCWTLSLALLAELGDRPGQARVLRRLGAVHARQGHWRQATEAYRQSLRLAARLDRHSGRDGPDVEAGPGDNQRRDFTARRARLVPSRGPSRT
jgi:cytochrome c-type biogenesis protein CcmH/NrfG